jgi:hypothetical protein
MAAPDHVGNRGEDHDVAWFTRLTRFGDAHLVYGQEANMSCGIASLMMCVFKINKLTPGATSVTVEKDIYQKYSQVMGSGYSPETTGTYPQYLATVLNSLTSGTWRWHNYAPTDVPQKLLDKVGLTAGLGAVVDVEPVILGVDWDLGGAHWVVVDTIREAVGSQYATICDPWDANVHMQAFSVGSPFFYDAASGGFMLNIWGTAPKGDTKPYQGVAAKGQVKNWGMICRD